MDSISTLNLEARMDDWRSWGMVGLGTAALGLVSAGIYYLGYRKGHSMSANSGTTVKGKSYEMVDALTNYLTQHNVDDSVLSKLRSFSVKHHRGRMTSPVEVGKLLTILCQAIGARKVIDIGVFTGCSAYAMAVGLPNGGKVVACDINMEYIQLGQPYWIEGGVSDKIDLRIQPATKTLQDLLDNGEDSSYDMIFIDADKESYPKYFELGLKLLRKGGMFVVDNALWSGRVADVTVDDDDTNGVRTINRLMRDEESVDFLLINVADGVGIAIKK